MPMPTRRAPCSGCPSSRWGACLSLSVLSLLSLLVSSAPLPPRLPFTFVQPPSTPCRVKTTHYRTLQHPATQARRPSFARHSIIMMPSSTPLVPYKAKGTDYFRFVDIYQRLSYDRVLLLGQFIDDSAANQIMSTLMYLHKEDRKAPIYVYFNVPGGHLRSGLAVYDTMKMLPNPIETMNLGLTTGMGAFLCGAGTKGRRFCVPNARLLMQKTGFEEQVYGQASDIVLEVESNMRDNKRFLQAMIDITGRTMEELINDFKRDFYLSAEESVEYGMIDKVIYPGVKDPIQLDSRDVGFGKFVSGSDQKYQRHSIKSFL